MLGETPKQRMTPHEEVQQAEKARPAHAPSSPQQFASSRRRAGLRHPMGPGIRAGLGRVGETHPASQGQRGKATHPPSVHCSHS